MSASVHKSDIGTIFRLTVVDQDDVVLDLATATSKKIRFEKPSGTVFEGAAVFPDGGDGTDGKMQYTVVAGELNEVGEWTIQGYVKFGTGEWYTLIEKFNVRGILTVTS